MFCTLKFKINNIILVDSVFLFNTTAHVDITRTSSLLGQLARNSTTSGEDLVSLWMFFCGENMLLILSLLGIVM